MLPFEFVPILYFDNKSKSFSLRKFKKSSSFESPSKTMLAFAFLLKIGETVISPLSILISAIFELLNLISILFSSIFTIASGRIAVGRFL